MSGTTASNTVVFPTNAMSNFTVTATVGTSTTNLNVNVIKFNLTPDAYTAQDSQSNRFIITTTPANVLTISNVTWLVTLDTQNPTNHIGKVLVGSGSGDNAITNTTQSPSQSWTGAVEKVYWYGYGQYSLTQPATTLGKDNKPNYYITAHISGELGGQPFSTTVTTNINVNLPIGDGGVNSHYDVANTNLNFQLISMTQLGDGHFNVIMDAWPQGAMITNGTYLFNTVSNQYYNLVQAEEEFHRDQYLGVKSIGDGGCGDVAINAGVHHFITNSYSNVEMQTNGKARFNMEVLANQSQADSVAKSLIYGMYSAAIDKELQFTMRFLQRQPEENKPVWQRPKYMEWKAKENIFKQAYLYYFTYHLEDNFELEPDNDNAQNRRESWNGIN
ncbi:hypothetical protein QPK87_12965 [Kamptonema cortianum]|uniref:Uncharacterized protein n=1 Tax=Geitlerinema calcuttense NRMC-F 0142 TaxID=2922238 RepID=A0ABT7M1F6_9CYAN|nr:hypothetical protein [Geitlerinema calcuttense]MDK3157479.1 hypothetical protein [Kamptonema cortianum]MDL5056896.1 hypothetical protein [Geitlerinema calcuttense NRMC-F 0142]